MLGPSPMHIIYDGPIFGSVIYKFACISESSISSCQDVHFSNVQYFTHSYLDSGQEMGAGDFLSRKKKSLITNHNFMQVKISVLMIPNMHLLKKMHGF